MERASDNSSNWPPLIFLSHSGKQKPGIVTHLYYALLSANHLPFFDKDTKHSLPAGDEYPPRILEACQGCKLGVVVLSEDYIQSLWPMLELQHLLSDSNRLIYPLFYELQPADLSNSSNLERWKAYWADKAPIWQERMLKLQGFNLDISSWADNLEKLHCRSGSVRTTPHQSDYDYIQAVVSNICFWLPPPRKYSLDDGFKGVKRMQLVIAGALEQEGSMGDDGVHTVGVHGVGGSGKTTLCRAMANFYSNGFPGRSFCLEFPSDVTDITALLRTVDPILKSLSCHASAQGVSNINEALSLLEGGLKWNKVFLAIDNVWDHNFEYAQRIMRMKCMRKSKILITSRSKQLVTHLLGSREGIDMSASAQEGSDMVASEQVRVQGIASVPRPYKDVSVLEIPSLTELEAMEVLKSYSCYSHVIPEDCLRSLARSCFFGEQCHPLCLKVQGSRLLKSGRASFDDQSWRNLISRLQVVGVNTAPNVDNIEEDVLQVVGKSWDGLPSHLQDIFAHLATCEVLAKSANSVEEIIRLLRLLRYDDAFTQDEMRCEVINVLEYHGLVEIVQIRLYDGQDVERLVIHDLHKQVAKSKVSSAAVACGLCADAHNVKPNGDNSVMTRKRFLRFNVVEERTWKAMFPHDRSMSNYLSRVLLKRRGPPQAQTRYLHIGAGLFAFMTDLERGAESWARRLQLGLGNLSGLRALRLYRIETLKRIEGWEGVPNLVWLELKNLSRLEMIGPIGCLEKLEWLKLQGCFSLKLETIVGGDDRMSLVRVGDHFPNLQCVDITSNSALVEVGPALPDVFPALKELNLSGCDKLKSFPDLKSGSLRVLDMSDCRELRAMEGSICSLTALQQLHLAGCRNLESMPDMRYVESLRSLELSGGCSWWRFVRTTNSDVMNPPQHLNTYADAETSDSRQQTDLPAGVEIDGHLQQGRPIEVSDALHGWDLRQSYSSYPSILSLDSKS